MHVCMHICTDAARTARQPQKIFFQGKICLRVANLGGKGREREEEKELLEMQHSWWIRMQRYVFGSNEKEALAKKGKKKNALLDLS